MLLSITCSPTLILLVRAPSGKTACTWGTTVLLRMPPSGPIRLLSCLMRDTTAKYCGKSLVMMRQTRFLSSSSGVSSSGGGGAEMDTCQRHSCRNEGRLCGSAVLVHHQRLTLVHAVEYLVEFLLGVLTVMLLPALSGLAPQDHQLPLFPPQGSKVGDLHNHRTGWVEDTECYG